MKTTRTRQVIKLDTRKSSVMLMSGFIALLFIKNAEAASLFVSRGIEICLTRLIPSLFPFLVVSSLLLSSGLDKVIGKTVGKPIAMLLGVSDESACAVILGFICGFPVGAKCACGLLGDGKIERKECERLLAICSIPSPAFVIGVIGGDILGSRAYGWSIWLMCAAVALGVGIFLRFIFPLSKSSTTHVPCNNPRKNFATILTASVRDGAQSMFYVCAFVIFFSAFLGALNTVITPLSLSNDGRAILFGFFELTSGSLQLSEVSGNLRLSLCALLTGWSGLSVHFQTMSICSNSNIRFSPYIISHALRAGVGFLAAMILGIILK